ncbi:Uncharacterized protein Adt_45484 [Abeliophyllum distichum]|uniref:Uncharacterized protein n=1 Tax=Abeliophyllum distichum TaxID=126358 RepID=A0ABD1PDS7_9LAMI
MAEVKERCHLAKKKGQQKKISNRTVKKKITISVPEGNKDWDFIMHLEYWSLGKVNAYSKNNIINTLVGRLSHIQKAMFKETCFAHYVDVDEITLNHQLIHQFLPREVR